LLGDVLGQNVTNLPGRIEVNGENFLDLNYTRMLSDNYLKLKAPNHFGGNAGSRIFSPYTDLNSAARRDLGDHQSAPDNNIKTRRNNRNLQRDMDGYQL